MKKELSVFAIVLASAAALSACGGSSPSKSNAEFDSKKTINVVSREDGSGTRGAFIELFGIEEKGSDGTKVDHTTEEAIIANKTDVMLSTVAGDDYAIGYVSLGSLNDTVKALNIDGVEPTAENVKNKTYSVSRPFQIATKGQPSALAQDFIDYILSSDGQAVISKSYIAVNDKAAAYSGSKPKGKIVVSGSSSVTPVMEKLKEAYLAVNKDAEIEIQQSDSTTGMKNTIEGICDIGMASRDLKDSEKTELTATPIALDGIAVIANTNNPLPNLSSEQVKSIFTGEAAEWDAVSK